MRFRSTCQSKTFLILSFPHTHPLHAQIVHLSTTVASNDAKEKKLADHCALPLTQSLRWPARGCIWSPLWVSPWQAGLHSSVCYLDPYLHLLSGTGWRHSSGFLHGLDNNELWGAAQRGICPQPCPVFRRGLLPVNDFHSPHQAFLSCWSPSDAMRTIRYGTFEFSPVNAANSAVRWRKACPLKSDQRLKLVRSSRPV